MREVNRGQGLFRMRIWQGENPVASYAVDDMLESVVSIGAPTGQYAEPVATTLEVARMLGHPSSYGLLGAEFVPASEGNLTIQVVLAGRPNEGVSLHDSLAGRLDTVQAGLPSEYGCAVLEVATSQAAALGPGVLRFSDAAHGMVGSSVAVFWWLTRAVLNLLTMRITEVTDEELLAVVLAAWKETVDEYGKDRARKERAG